MYILRDVFIRFPGAVVIWAVGALYIFYRLCKDNVEYTYCKSDLSNKMNSLTIGAFISLIFTFLFILFGSIATTLVLESEPVVESTYGLDKNDSGDYYTLVIKRMRPYKTRYEFMCIDEYNRVSFKYADHDDIQIEYIDDTEEPYVEMLVYHYTFKPADKTFFVWGGTEYDTMTKTLYRLHIPKNTK